MTAREKAIVVCPGSYDPITNGHLDVIRRAAALYDEVVVAVVNRSVRKDKALFGIDERMSFIEHAIADLDGVRAEPFSTLVVEFARHVGAKAIVKGLRAISDFEYELEMNQLNRRQDPEWRQGARHLRGQDRRSRPRRGGETVAGRAETLTNLETQWMS
jgi:pantetheine-phosphate adenylyltransferase